MIQEYYLIAGCHYPTLPAAVHRQEQIKADRKWLGEAEEPIPIYRITTTQIYKDGILQEEIVVKMLVAV